jgi:hypothetical protein
MGFGASGRWSWLATRCTGCPWGASRWAGPSVAGLSLSGACPQWATVSKPGLLKQRNRGTMPIGTVLWGKAAEVLVSKALGVYEFSVLVQRGSA